MTGYVQIITPDPDIPCAPGWCLQYVRQTFRLPARYASATEAWEASPAKHYGRDFPAGVWVPVWYGLDTTPLGHVVLLAPDGSCYSTSDLGSTPHHHPDLTDLEAYYAYYGMTLTYRGWTDDVAGYTVITPAGITAAGTLTTETGDLMPETLTDKNMHDKDGRPVSLEDIVNSQDRKITALLDLLTAPIQDPSDPAAAYSPLAYIVWAATNAKTAAQAAGTAAGPSLDAIAARLRIVTTP